MKSRTQAVQVGRKVLAGFDRGRAVAIAQAQARAAKTQSLVVICANADRISGKPTRGRAGRIARKLHNAISERHVKRILDSLSSVSNSLG